MSNIFNFSKFNFDKELNRILSVCEFKTEITAEIFSSIYFYLFIFFSTNKVTNKLILRRHNKTNMFETNYLTSVYLNTLTKIFD